MRAPVKLSDVELSEIVPKLIELRRRNSIGPIWIERSKVYICPPRKPPSRADAIYHGRTRLIEMLAAAGL